MVEHPAAATAAGTVLVAVPRAAVAEFLAAHRAAGEAPVAMAMRAGVMTGMSHRSEPYSIYLEFRYI
ncbi:hypothetical protein [Falsiroseomonas selenitidurans]|uniref:Uncharacterized protein n=1 Tax=Falsiroseomonas selenitidurans TaxID=2716335 RepID=A0ABX1E9L4_9PROT|nr:hypothetical protein [Falsiroseomonas selenitidurans]NKC33920.1 hypothetical protein [Falsiroseomonas selenitidurans]